MNFKKFKISCSNISSLMSNASHNRPLTDNQWEEVRKLLDREKELTNNQLIKLKEYIQKEIDYDPRVLSSGTKSDLLKMYSWQVYNKASVGVSSYENMSIEKGTIAESESIQLLSELDGVKYKKNEKKYENRFITGIPDIVYNARGKRVIDIKSSLDINSFLSKVDSELSAEYMYQMIGYLELVKADYGEVCFCLVNMPPAIIEQEIRKLRAKYFLYGKSDEETENRVFRLQNSMIFDDIPIERRVIRFRVERDSEKMAKVYKRVQVARNWMEEFHKIHTKLK